MFVDLFLVAKNAIRGLQVAFEMRVFPFGEDGDYCDCESAKFNNSVELIDEQTQKGNWRSLRDLDQDAKCLIFH
jgi:hypothetical protein